MDARAISRPIAILGTAHVVPDQRVLSTDLDEMLGLKPGTVEHKTGLKQRYFAGQGDSAAKLAAQACEKALQDANLCWDDIDLLVSASATMDQGLPNNAALVHSELGLDPYGIATFDINSSCLSFVVALDHLSWLLAAGVYSRVMIVSADIASCGLNWEDLGESGIFGDGAAAAVIGLSPGGASQILASRAKTLSEGVGLCEIRAGGSRYHPSKVADQFQPLTYFHMNGKAVFKLVSQHIAALVEALLDEAGLSLDELDCVVLHQASLLAMNHAIKRLKIPEQKIINIFPDYGNQVAASLPTALDIAIKQGKISRGQRVMLLGSGAGVTISGLILVY